ncbi:MAG: hypothetical protein JST12_05610 [Armatimonadetes bacterium]|nr:hypothetical protein [Armatimonadota bacterium]
MAFHLEHAMKLGISESRTKVRVADLEKAFLDFLSSHSTAILRWAMALVFIWFGALKLVPGVSPAEAIAGRTLQELSLGVLKPSLSLPLLALLEVTIGFGFLFGRRLKLTLWLLMGHMAGTLTPFVLFPHETMSSFGVPTMLGQYILKNCVLIAAGLVLFGSLRTKESEATCGS